jgi:hypothetical protein
MAEGDIYVVEVKGREVRHFTTETEALKHVKELRAQGQDAAWRVRFADGTESLLQGPPPEPREQD